MEGSLCSIWMNRFKADRNIFVTRCYKTSPKKYCHLTMTEIEDFIPYYPDPDADDFTYQISRKKENARLYLNPTEDVSDTPGDLLQNQIFLEQFFSENTPYTKALLAHRPGTGKTCTASAIVERYRIALISGNPRKPALVMVKSEEIARYITQDISRVCTFHKYVPRQNAAELKQGKVMTEETRIARLNREIAKTYEIVTIDTYLRNLSMDDEEVRIMHSGRDIIVDEAHTIRPQPPRKKKKGLTALVEEAELAFEAEAEAEEEGLIATGDDATILYNQQHRLLHLTTDSRQLLLTGTPVWDQAHEIASLANLILDDDQQLPTGRDFDARYFNDDGSLNEDTLPELKERLKGKVSFLREMITSAERIEMGTRTPWLKYIKIFPDAMSDLQAEYAEKASQSVETKMVKVKGKMVERQTVGGVIYKLARDAMNMVLPIFDEEGVVTDIGFGPETFKKYIVKQTKKRTKKEQVTTVQTYSIDDPFLREELSKNLAEYSIKFAAIIADAKSHPDQIMFIYNEEVTGLGGAIMQGLCMELHGFHWIKSASDISNPSPRRRFAVITSDPQTTNNPKQIQDLLDSASRPDNKYAERLQIIIGSEKIALGLSIKNVRRIHLVMPHWNIPSLDQAQARGIRFGGHAALKPEERKVYIFRHAAVETPGDDERGYAKGVGYPAKASFSDAETTDIYIYRIAETKDYRNAQIYRVLKEVSPDCAVFYKRNVLATDVDETRECDYQVCNYECDGFPPVSKSGKVWNYKVPEAKIDYSTYNLLYASDRVNEIIAGIIELFHNYFSLLIDSVQALLGIMDSEKPLLLHAIDTIINSRLVIRNRYGFVSYLKEDGNMLFLGALDDAIGAAGGYINATYTETPLVTDISSLASLVEILEYEHDLEVLKKACSKIDRYLPENFDKLGHKTRILLLESAYLINQRAGDTDNSVIDFILDTMENELYEMDDGTIIHILYSDEFRGSSYAVSAKDIKASGSMRIYDPKNPDAGWTYVPPEKEDDYIKQIRERVATQKEIGFDDNPYGIFGWISKVDQAFRLNVKPVTKRKGAIRGKNCNSFDIPDLVDIFVSRIKYFPVREGLEKKKRGELMELIKGRPGYQNLKETIDTFTDRELRGVLSLITSDRKMLCDGLRGWLEEKKLLFVL